MPSHRSKPTSSSLRSKKKLVKEAKIGDIVYKGQWPAIVKSISKKKSLKVELFDIDCLMNVKLSKVIPVHLNDKWFNVKDWNGVKHSDCLRTAKHAMREKRMVWGSEVGRKRAVCFENPIRPKLKRAHNAYPAQIKTVASAGSATGQVTATPAAVQGSASPAAVQGSASPAVVQGSASPAAVQGSATPAAVQGSVLPAAVPGSASSAAVQGSASPTVAQGAAAPAVVQGAAAPVAVQGAASPASKQQAASQGSKSSNSSAVEVNKDANQRAQQMTDNGSNGEVNQGRGKVVIEKSHEKADDGSDQEVEPKPDEEVKPGSSGNQRAQEESNGGVEQMQGFFKATMSKVFPKYFN